ncbi:MAG: RagB/SusD family nutrient uptake outer membrane protein [Bacteroidales bacterium]|nr:MAG: RagB/SusD family nutrient uptake outer membrane protein [Bacteroidales bacterium]
MNNKIIYIGLITILAGILLFPGCEKELEPKFYQDLTVDNFFETEGDFNAALIAIYNPFTAHWGDTDPGDDEWYAALYNANNRTYLMRSEITSDEIYGADDADLLNFTWGPSTYSYDVWSSTYAKIRFVARATDVIDKISKSDANEIVKNRYIAQAKILRAWLMYVLYDFFGPLNVKLDPETLSDTEIIPRLSDEAYCSAIEQDLLDALAMDETELPDKYNGDGANWGRVSRGVARMLLLRLYMHKKRWADAEAVGMDLMNMGYALEPKYREVFTKTANNEIIYAVPCSDASPNWYMHHLFPAGIAIGFCIDANNDTVKIERGAGWYMYSMPWDFYDKFSAGDDRKSVIIAEYVSRNGDTITRANVDTDLGQFGAIPLKYTQIEPGDGGPDYPYDWVVFRYAEVLLSVAEAINEQRGPADAYQYVNQVRARAMVPEWSGLTQEQFRDSILDERGRELFSEGVRRQDLIRHGKFIQYARDRGITNAEDHQVLFPIPIDVIIEGGGTIVQNPGYVN